MKKEPTPRQRQALEMRAKIQSAALTLFNREGFENVSVEEIAQTVGCSVGNIYHYFKSKDELAIRVTQMVDEAYTDLEQSYLASAVPAREKLLDFVGRSLEISARDEMLYKAFIHGLRYPEQAVLKRMIRAYISGFCGSWWIFVKRRGASTRPTTRMRWWRTWWCCTVAPSLSGASIRRASM